MSSKKIYDDPAQLVPVLERLRADGKKLVFANGCFELLHVGHLRYLYAARELGDALIVAVNSDESMRLIKPDRRPANPDHERMQLMAALEMVDFVVPLRERTPCTLIGLLRPEVHTKGTDYDIERMPERVVVESYGGRIELVGGPKDHSTTDMLKALRDPKLLS